MSWTPAQIPQIDPNDPYSYPDIDPRILLRMEPSIFNQWRREFDFPRIVRYLKSKLFLFETWQSEQNISDQDLIFFGPARFIRKNDNPIFITESDKDNQEDKKRVFIDHKKLIKFQSNPSFYGTVTVLKKIVPFLDWVLARKDKPKNLSENSIFGNTGTSMSGNTSNWKFNNEFRILNIGSIYERVNITTNPTMILGSRGGFNNESKILEFLNFDFLKVHNFIWNGECFLFYCNFSNVSINSSSIAQIHFYKSNLSGLIISESSLHNLFFENCEIKSNFRNPETIEKSEINFCQFSNTDFFRYYNFVKIRNSEFKYTRRSSSNYLSIKNLYTSTGDFYNSSKYFYLEKKSELFEKVRLINYIKENRIKFNNADLINNSLKFVAFKDRKSISLKKSIKYYFVFLIYFLIHQTVLVKDWINYLSRGFGEKPYRILISFIPLILLFTIVGTILQEDSSFGNLLLENSFNLFGKFELDPESKVNSIFRVFKAAMGVFLISLFVADLSSKKRY